MWCNLPIIDKIIGRDTEVLDTPKSKILIVHFFTGIFEHFPEIKQFQVKQQTKGGRIQIRYIKGINFTKIILNDIRNKIYERAEENFPLYFSNVEQIKPFSIWKTSNYSKGVLKFETFYNNSCKK